MIQFDEHIFQFGLKSPPRKVVIKGAHHGCFGVVRMVWGVVQTSQKSLHCEGSELEWIYPQMVSSQSIEMLKILDVAVFHLKKYTWSVLLNCIYLIQSVFFCFFFSGPHGE